MGKKNEQGATGHGSLVIENELTVFTAAPMKERFEEFLSRGHDLEIDLSGVSEMDSAGFQLLWAIKREAAQVGKTLRFVGHSQSVIDVLDTFNMTKEFGDPVYLPSSKRTRKRKGA